MPQKLVILLSGWAGSGKDAAASIMVEEMNFERLAFADLLKADVSRISGLPLSTFHDPREKDVPIAGSTVTPRHLLLAHARVVRSVDPNIYSRGLVDTIDASHHGRFVISDWRYRSEYEFLLDTNVHIRRGRIVRAGITASDDPSEHDLDNDTFDFTLTNDGCISDLRDALKATIRQYIY